MAADHKWSEHAGTIAALLAVVLCCTATAVPAAAQQETAVVTVEDVEEEEGDGHTFTFTLDKAVAGSFTLSVSVRLRSGPDTTHGTADSKDVRALTDAASILTFMGTAGEQKTVTVATVDDDIWEEDETFTVTMAKRTGTSAGLDVSDTAVGTILNNDVGVLEIRDSQVSLEGATHRVRVALTKSMPRNVDIAVRFEDGSATGGVDYDNTPRVLSFTGPDDLPSSEDDHVLSFDMEYFEDEIVEPSEDFVIFLEAGVDDIDDSASSVGVILDDDEARISTPTQLPTVREGEEVVFELTLDRATYTAFSVDASFADFTAAGGVDYDNTAQTLFFEGLAGETQSLTVATFDDDLSEGAEQFIVDWTPSAEFVKLGNQSSVTILDADLPLLTLTPLVTVTEGEDMEFTAVLDGNYPGGFTATTGYESLNGSTSGDDFDDRPQTLDFAGVARESQRFTVTTVDDAIPEADQAFRVSLNVEGTPVADALGSILDDDEQMSMDVTTSATHDEIVLTWPPVPGALGYRLEIRGPGIERARSTTGTRLVWSGLASNTSHDLRAIPLTDPDDPESYLPGYVWWDGTETTTGAPGERGLVFSRTLVPVDEGSSATYTVALATAPSGNVTVALSGTGRGVGAGPLSLTFTPANWSTAQTETVTAAEDSNTESETVTLAHIASGGGYDGVSGDVTVRTIDDDTDSGANRPPEFEQAAYHFELEENRDGRQRPVELGAVTASDPDGDGLTYELVAGDRARFGIGPRDGSVTYIGAGEDFETEPNRYELTVRVTDPSGAVAQVTVVVTVVDVNDAPVANDDEAETDEDRPVTVDVLANDTDEDGDSLRVESVSAAAHGTTGLTAGGEVLYTPEADYHGTDQFTYVVSDGEGGTATAAVEVTVRPVSDAPVANDDEAETDEDRPVTVDVLTNDTDADGDRLRVESVSGAAHGTTGLTAGGGVLYTPEADYHGADRFTYVVSDGAGGTATAAVDVTVRSVNDAPVTSDDEAATDEDRPVTVDVLANDTDADGDRLRVESVSAAAHGTTRVSGGGVLYTPEADYHGADRFTYVVSDDAGGTATAAVAVTVRSVNDAPVVSDDEAATDEDRPVTVDVLANDTDADGDRLRVESVSAAAHGTTRVVSGGGVLYTPEADYHGADRFTYVVSDDAGATATAAVAVTVRPVNDAPMAVGVIPDQALDEGGGTGTVELAPFFSDIDGDALAFSASSSTAAVVTAAVAGSVLTLTPVEYGSATVTVTARDGGGLTATQTFTVGVSDRLVRVVLEHTLAALARSHLASARATLRRRVMAGPAEASNMTLLGRAVPLSGAEARAQGEGMLATLGAAAREGRAVDLGTLTGFRDGADPLRGSGFVLAPGAGRGGTGWASTTIWGQGDMQTFQGAPSAASDYEGDLQTGYAGLDVRLTERWLAGVAVARSFGAGDWTVGGSSGSLATKLTAVHPYIGWSNGTTSVWTMAGHGRGLAENVRRSGRTGESGLRLRMGLIELGRRLGVAPGGLSFGARADLAWAELRTEAGQETIDGQTAAVHQARIGVEVSRPMRLGGLELVPFGEAHARIDGGSGQTGRGVELLGGLRASAGPVRLDAQGRMLTLHSVTGYEERGVAVTLSLGTPGAAGPSLSLSPTWGDHAAGGGGALWGKEIDRRAPGEATPGTRTDDWGLDVRGGYGVRLPGGQLMTWFGSYSRSRSSPGFQTGVRLNLPGT